MDDNQEMVFPDIPELFRERLPDGFVNDVRGWTFTRKEVAAAAKSGKMLTMDIDMDGLGVCSLNCAHCFRRNKEFYAEKRMGREELFGYIADARRLGLRSVKIIGPGEPLEDLQLLSFLERLNALGLITLIFTKAYILGDDALCRRIHGIDGGQLIAQLKRLNVSLLVGTTSFVPGNEDYTVGRQGYHAARGEAIKRLVEAGFNKFVPGEATRLAFVCTPLMPSNIGEAFEIYKWARRRNIQPVMAPTMIAGRALDELLNIVPSENELLDLYVKINLWAIENGVFTLEALRLQGMAAYAGGAPCNKVAVGVFLRGDGKVLRCPGDDLTVIGNLKCSGLAEIWNGCENRLKYAGRYNNGCPPKEGKSFPDDFFAKVTTEVERRLISS